MSETEAVAIWMMRNGYATGHGDTVEDMLAELETQAKERGARAAIRRREEDEAAAREWANRQAQYPCT